MKQVYLLRPTHQHIANSRNNIHSHIMLNTILQNNISVVTMYAAKKNRIHLIQLFQIFQALLHLYNLFHMKLTFQIILIDQAFHSLSDVIDDHSFTRWK